ncbi:WD40 repeat domain-containing protein, partial [Escherichia coli]|uniref:WD40 repeat domain-containing protein n=1 Tax=Escherichia coli TaxID=562 RepID=UPI0034D2D8C3
MNHVAFSLDGSRLITAGSGTVRVWNIASGKEVLHFSFDTSINAMALAPDGKTLALGVSYQGRRCGVQMWDVSTGKLLRRLPE